GHRLRRADDGELRGAVHAADLLRAEPVLLRVEVGLGGHLRPERARVEEGDPSGCRSPLAEQAPELLPADAARRDHADAGYVGSSLHEKRRSLHRSWAALPGASPRGAGPGPGRSWAAAD